MLNKVYLPTMILTTFNPVIIGVLTEFATKLSKYENYETENEYEAAMTQKIFVLNFITSYLPVMLTAFVYVPFAKVIVPYLDIFSLTVMPFAENEKQMTAPASGFKINPDRLKKQMIYFAVTAQLVGQALEVVLPYVKREGFSWYKKYQSKRAARSTGRVSDQASAFDNPEEKTFLNRVRQEAELDIYDVTTDLREVVVQFGYLALFSIIWPVTSVSFLINDWIELRTDVVKICLESQRPTPMRSDGIGPWLDTLEFLAWVGSITTAAIAYMFSNGGIGPGGEPKNIEGWKLMLTIFIAEHAYLAVRFAVRYAVSKLDSPGRQKERQERFLVRKRYLEESLGDQARKLGQPQNALASLENVNRRTLEEEARASSQMGPGAQKVETRFWLRQRSWQETVREGARLIEAAAVPAETKKVR
jgi:anoctamin-10